MKTKVARSCLKAEPMLEHAIAAHAAEIRSWIAHEAKVKADEDKASDDPTKHVHWPRPSASPAVEACVDASGNASYEVIDDPPEVALASLEAKKQKLNHAISLAEQAAISAIRPYGKHRADALREASIRSEDAKAMAERGFVAKFKDALSGADVDGALSKRRSKDDNDFLGKCKRWSERIFQVQEKAAQAHSEVEDLTAENVDDYEVPEL